ncbi:pectin lyase-like protein, partial [Massarina eburnea CBS 473.64]
APCIPDTANSPNIDDTPAIQATLQRCGINGSISIPAGSVYNIHTPIDFSPCHFCLFQLEGTLNISNTASEWHGKPAVLHFPSVQGARVVSNTGTGLINGNGVGGSEKFAPMVNITSGSSTLVFRNFRIIDPIGTFFDLDGANSEIEFVGLSLGWSETPATIPSLLDGFSIANTTGVKIWRTAIDKTRSCVNLQNGIADTLVGDTSCNASHGGVWFDVEFQRTANMEQTASNVSIRNVTIAHTDTAIGIRAANTGTFTATNVTWEDIHLDTVNSWQEITSCIG